MMSFYAVSALPIIHGRIIYAVRIVLDVFDHTYRFHFVADIPDEGTALQGKADSNGFASNEHMLDPFSSDPFQQVSIFATHFQDMHRLVHITLFMVKNFGTS